MTTFANPCKLSFDKYDGVFMETYSCNLWEKSIDYMEDYDKKKDVKYPVTFLPSLRMHMNDTKSLEDKKEYCLFDTHHPYRLRRVSVHLISKRCKSTGFPNISYVIAVFISKRKYYCVTPDYETNVIFNNYKILKKVLNDRRYAFNQTKVYLLGKRDPITRPDLVDKWYFEEYMYKWQQK